MACGASDPPAQSPDAATTNDASLPDATADAAPDAPKAAEAGTDASASLVQDLLAKVATYKQVSAGKFAPARPQIGSAAKNLGINPDPKVGGVDKGVTYIAFTGTAAVVKKKEDHTEAVTLGGTLTADLLKNN